MLQGKNYYNTCPLNPVSSQSKVWSKNDWLAILILFLLSLAYFYSVIIPTDYRILGDENHDMRNQYFCWRYFGFNTLSKGILPLWNPYSCCGIPFIAGAQSAIFYPLNLIFLILPIHTAINYSIILHVFLSGVFTYLYLRFTKLNPQSAIQNPQLYSNGFSRSSCMVSSIVFMFCAPQIFHVYAGHLTILNTIMWLPLILLLSEIFISTKYFLYAILGGVAVAFNILAGQPQYSFYTAIAVFMYFVIRIIQEFNNRKDWKTAGYCISGFLIIYAVGCLLSTIQILPAFEMAKHSVRHTLSYEWVGHFSFPPENFITLFIPEFFGNITKTPYWGRYLLWEMSLYVGILPLILCALASFYYRNKFTKTFLVMALISSILALGKFTPLFKILYTFVPGFNLFRGNSKFIFIVAFSLSILSGIGAEYLRNHLISKKTASRFLRFAAGIIAAMSLFLLIFFLFRMGFGKWHYIINKVYLLGGPKASLFNLENLKNPEFLSATFKVTTTGVVKFIILSILSLLIVSLWIERSLKRHRIVLITTALIIGDLWFFGNQYIVTFDSKKYMWDEETLTLLKNDPEPFRITTAGFTGPNHSMVHNIANIGGYEANVIKEYSEFMNLSEGNPLEKLRILMEVTHISKLTNLLNLKYIFLSPGGSIECHPAIKLVSKNSKYTLVQNTTALPRAFIVHESKTLQGRDAIFKELSSREFNPLKYIILEEPSMLVKNIAHLSLQQEPIPTFLEYSPNRVTIKATLLDDGYLVLGDTFYPGWNAYVDGKKSRVFKTDYILRSVFLEKGEHIVKFVYEPKSFTIGMIITLTSMVILIPLSVFTAIRHRNSRNSTETGR
ncbi:MAG TPA: YfhO family protein [Candidatus Wunengus sp. YC60]|uniref:YfhO family protein n=1 Tax=Candidatus Wunengus sp. YC60 TaxID=3367697 RepID=UPI0040273166